MVVSSHYLLFHADEIPSRVYEGHSISRLNVTAVPLDRLTEASTIVLLQETLRKERLDIGDVPSRTAISWYSDEGAGIFAGVDVPEIPSASSPIRNSVSSMASCIYLRYGLFNSPSKASSVRTRQSELIKEKAASRGITYHWSIATVNKGDSRFGMIKSRYAGCPMASSAPEC